MSRITPNTYGKALAALVERHNTNPEYLQERNRELEDENARLRAEIKRLRAALADADIFHVEPAPTATGRHINGRPAVTLAEAAKLANISYQAAYRRITGGVKSVPKWEHAQDSNRIIWVYTDQGLS
jgi:hypothetical protein